MSSEELDLLRRNFKAFIEPHLAGENAEDCELVWQWEKFVFDKTQRAQDGHIDKAESPLLRTRIP